MSIYALPLKDPSAELFAPAAFLSEKQGYTRDSARAFLRSNPGFIGRRLPFEAAKKLSADSGRAGFDTMLIPEAELPALPPAEEALKLEPRAEGFRAVTRSTALFIPYDAITIFSASSYDAEIPRDTVTALKPGLAAKIAALAGVPLPPQPAPAVDTFFRADIISGEGPLRFLLKPESLDFSPLGPARSPSSLLNFRALLDTLSAPALGALKNRFLAAFIASQPLSELKVASPGAADTELSRLLLLSPGKK